MEVTRATFKHVGAYPRLPRPMRYIAMRNMAPRWIGARVYVAGYGYFTKR